MLRPQKLLGFIAAFLVASTFHSAQASPWCLASLSKLAIPFGFIGKRKVDPLEQSFNALESLRDQHPELEDYWKHHRLELETWQRLRPEFNHLLNQFRKLSRAEKRQALQFQSQQIDQLARQLSPVSSPGIHMNYHGGIGYQYISKGGILATKGNAAINWHLNSTAGALNSHDLRKMLEDQPPTVFYYPMTVGSFALQRHREDIYFILFDVQRVLLQDQVYPMKAFADAISFPSKQHGEVGIPTEEFALPPLYLPQDSAGFAGLSHTALSSQEVKWIRLHYLKTLLFQFSTEG